MKITIVGAGSVVFSKNVIGDCMLTPSLRKCEIALYDIDPERLENTYRMTTAINATMNQNRSAIQKFIGLPQMKAALKNATFVISTVNIGGYDPCTIIDFEIPKKFGLRQTIGDTIGIGGIFRGLRTIPFFKQLTDCMAEACPDALLLNYVNPMGIISGYLQRYTGVKSVGLCHSTQVCSEQLLKALGMEDKLEGRREVMAGINHMCWLLEIQDKFGNDLYPEIRRRALQKNATEKHNDMVRFEYIRRLGYYCSESSEHNAEYNNFFIKSKYPQLIDDYNIPLDEYIRRCLDQIEYQKKQKETIIQMGTFTHERSCEFASYIMNAVVENNPYKIHGNVINNGLITNLPADACVEVPCLIDGMGIHPTRIGKLPTQLAAMNMSNINVQLLTIEAAVTQKRDTIYQAAMMDPHTSSELSIDDIVAMCDALIEAHGNWLPAYN